MDIIADCILLFLYVLEGRVYRINYYFYPNWLFCCPKDGCFERKIQKKKVAIEVNGEIVEKKKYLNLILNNNDKVEIVHFIGGG